MTSELMIVCYTLSLIFLFFFFFFNDTATTEIYTLSLHDALPICWPSQKSPISRNRIKRNSGGISGGEVSSGKAHLRSEEHTSELQSRLHLVCRLLLEKKKNSILQQQQANTNIRTRPLNACTRGV